jgi:putative ABC transport system substrate-binding protein
MKRRDFIKAVGGLPLAWSQARAQDRIRRVGVLINFAADDRRATAHLAKFRQGLVQLGWTDGRNIQLDIRYGNSDPHLYPVRAKELVAPARSDR